MESDSESFPPWDRAFRFAGWGVAIGSADGTTLLKVNPAFARMHGYSEEELAGRPILQMFAPQSRAALVHQLSSIHAAGHLCFESVHLRRDGSTFPVRIDATAVRDPDGNVLYRVVNVQDISEQRATEAALRQSQEFFQVIFEAAAVGMAIADEGGRYVRVNQAMADFVGYSKDELVGMSYHDITHPDDLEANVRQRDLVLSGSCSMFQMEKRYLRKDGQVVWALMVVAAPPSLEGYPRFTIGQMLDISSLKRSEQALRTSEARLARAQQIGRIGDWQWDLAGSTITHSAEAGRIVLGHPAQDELTAADFLQRIHPDDCGLAAQALGGLVCGRVPKAALDVRVLLEDGSSRVVQVRGEFERGGQGQALQLAGTLQDVTERKAIESDLRQSRRRLREMAAHQQDLIEAERKRIAHEIHDEIGSLLTALKLNVSLLRLRHGEQAGVLAQAAEMQELLDRTIQVVRDVATSLRPAVVDLGVIPAIEWLATDFSRRYGIACHLEVAEPAQALTDRQTEVIFRIAQETLTNVARHANAKQVWMALGHEGGVFFMEIQDDGRGLPEGFQAGERTFGMLGMGERARSVGGEILIAGRPGQGVRVYLELPLVEGGPS